MDKKLMNLLAKKSPEEKRLLSGGEFERGLYTADEDFTISGARLLSGKHDIGVRTHTRFTVFPEHNHNFSEIMIVLSGKFRHSIGGETISLVKGDMLFLNKHVRHSIERAEESDIGVNIIMSDEFLGKLSSEVSGTVFSRFIRENARASGEPMYLLFKTGGEKPYENIIENLLRELLGERRNTEVMSRTVSLLLLLLSLDGERILSKSSYTPDADEKRRLEILSYIKSHFRDASLSELSGKTYLCVPYLSKTIKRLFDKTFSDLLLEERIERAKELLREGELSVGEVVSAVGYENDSYFHKRFREAVGVTPLEYRRTHS